MDKRYQRGMRIRKSKDRLSVLWFTDSDTPLVSFVYCIVCPLIYRFWYPFGIFCPLYCLSFDLRILIPLWYLLSIVLSVLWFTDSDTPLVSFVHCIVCPLIYRFWYPFDIFCLLYCLSFDLRILIPLWYLLFIVSSVLWFRDSDTPLVSFVYWICKSKDRQYNGQKIPKGYHNP
jgi:hypothetical protein